MTATDPLAPIRARAEAATPGPWEARTTGRARGDHWYVCDDGESIAHISAQDGINEDQREPDAKFIAHAREDVPALLAALDAVMSVHEPRPDRYEQYAPDRCVECDKRHQRAPNLGGNDIRRWIRNDSCRSDRVPRNRPARRSPR